MRKVVGVLVMSLGLTWAGVASAQVPRTMSYQGTLTDASGTPVADGTYTLAFGLYTAASGGAAIFTEQQSVAVTDGAFSAIIGGVTAGGIPASVPFTAQYYLGISVNGAAELSPRTALTPSPYALTSAALQLPAVQTGSAATPLLRLTNTDPAAGDAIYGAHTAATGTGVGVRGETWATGSLATGVFGTVMATGPSGPNSAGVQGFHLGSGTGGAGVRGYQSGLGNGIEGYAPSGNGVFGVSTTGRAGYYQVTGPASSSSAVEVETAGLGRAGYFKVMNASSTASAIEGLTQGPGNGVLGSSANGVGVFGTSTIGTGVWGSSSNVAVYGASSGGDTTSRAVGGFMAGLGRAGHFQVFNVLNTSPAVEGTTNGTGVGVLGVHSATSGTAAGVRGETNSTDSNAVGVTGIVLSTAPGGYSAGVRGINNGTSGNGIGVYGSQAGGGWGVYGEAASGVGVFGTSSSGGGVFGSSQTGNGVSAFATGAASIALFARHSGASGDLAVFQNNASNVARIDKTGRGFFNGGTQTGGADLAESFDVEGDHATYEPGDVLAISTRSDRTLERSAEPNSTRVVGVYATKPGVLLTDLDIDADASHRVPLGVVGVIPTKVSAENGAIHRGDLLVTADTPGHAMKAGATPAIGTVLGKALQEFTGPGTGVINVLVNVK